MPIEFRYFRTAETEIGFLPGSRVCSLCGQTSRCFELDGVICAELSETERKGKIGCYDCLRQDRFGYPHDTEVGFISEDGFFPAEEPDTSQKRVFVVASDGEATADTMPLVQPPKPHINEEAIAELRRTPSFPTWQEVAWPVHCDDFMAYLGIWGPKNFDNAAPAEEGRQIFLDMVDSVFHSRWPEGKEPRFGENFVAFECLNCQSRLGIWDID